MIWLLVLMIITALILELVSLKRSAIRLNYHLEPSRRSVEQGEEFKLRTTVDNATEYNIPYLMLEELIPEGVEFLDEDTLRLIPDGNYTVHQSVIFVRKHQRVRRNVRVVIRQRGMFKFRQATLSIGDFLGLKSTEKLVEQSNSVVVYPKRLEDERLNQVLSDIFGEVSVQSFLYEDPILVRGYRDYTGREPLRSISFPMSAKRNQLTVKEFDHTREEMVDIIFDVGYKGEFDHYFDQLETMFSMVRTICESFEKKGISYRLITNAYYSSMDVRGVNVIQSGGSGGSSFAKILEILGIASRAAMCDTDELLRHAFLKFSQEKSFLYISQRREGETEQKLRRLEQGYGVSLHRIYGEDYEATFLKSEGKEDKEVC